MKQFSIEGFAAECKQAMANSNDRREAVSRLLEQTLAENDSREIISTLEAAIPPDANIGEMIVHTSPELTMLYARVPARFQSGIHNHTVFACIGQLSGAEVSTVYKQSENGQGLRPVQTLTSREGEVVSLPGDAIHHIENPNNTTSASLHIYGGDFSAIMEERSLWSYDNHEETTFSFQGLVKESVKGMKMNHNQAGLDAVVKAIPSLKPLVEA